ncbi:hypothetical protein KCP69_11625 [Salmonella enterica subsp. enterica]|nr:hypothetical protein KCP69_11625 [Salmonella enterica subsp. enterica]
MSSFESTGFIRRRQCAESASLSAQYYEYAPTARATHAPTHTMHPLAGRFLSNGIPDMTAAKTTAAPTEVCSSASSTIKYRLRRVRAHFITLRMNAAYARRLVSINWHKVLRTASQQQVQRVLPRFLFLQGIARHKAGCAA